ncbi:MAG: hypothetical protein PHX89_01245 [bacterium]|nr:hypothetical protein [bacterium]
MREEKVLAQVKELFNHLRIPDKVLASLTAQIKESYEYDQKYHQDAMMRIQNDYSRLEKKKKDMYEDKLDGRITAEEYDEMVAEYKSKQAELNLQLQSYAQTDKSFPTTTEAVLNLVS